MVIEETGICISCGHKGPIGTACGNEACQRKNHYFIPDEYAKKAEQDDPYIGRKLDDFVFVDVIGEGGFGKVYLALMMPVLMPVALKFLTRTGSEDMLQRFYREARSLAMLSHPNIVHLKKYGIHNNKPYIAMEFVDSGRSLSKEIRDRVRAKKAFNLAEVVHIVDQILNALKVAHGHDVVHRDIKPENILLQDIEGDPIFVKVLDFGLAKFTDQDSKMSMVLGTPVYMAPEQLGAEHEIGPWTDLYAVAVIVFEILTGRRPFKGASPREVIGQKIDPDYDFIARVRDLNLPPGLINFLRKGMSVSAEDRFLTVDGFRTAFHGVLGGLGKKQTKKLFAGTLEDLLDTTGKKKVQYGSTDAVPEPERPETLNIAGKGAVHSDPTLIEDEVDTNSHYGDNSKSKAKPLVIAIIAGVVIFVGVLGYAIFSGTEKHSDAASIVAKTKPVVKQQVKTKTPDKIVVGNNVKKPEPTKPAVAKFKNIEIRPMFKSSDEVAPGVKVYLNDKMAGITKNGKGISVKMPVDKGRVEVKLVGKSISHSVVSLIDPAKITGKKLDIKVEMSW